MDQDVHSLIQSRLGDNADYDAANPPQFAMHLQNAISLELAGFSLAPSCGAAPTFGGRVLWEGTSAIPAQRPRLADLTVNIDRGAM